MPKEVAPFLERVAKSYSELAKIVHVGHLDLSRAVNASREALKKYKVFDTACNQGFSGRLSKISSVKPEKLKTECGEIKKIAKKYVEHAAKLAAEWPETVTNYRPSGQDILRRLEMVLEKAEKTLTNLEAHLDNGDLKKQLGTFGKEWSDGKSHLERAISGCLKLDVERLTPYERTVKAMDKLDPYFGSQVLPKFKALDQATDEQSRALAAKLEPVAAGLIKKVQDFLPAAADGRVKANAEDLISACKKLDREIKQLATG